MKTSILMSVYNGHKYIYDQLNSIRDQTVPADEVIIIDDASTDNSANIIDNYIIENQLKTKWKLIKNPNNLGWKRNFMEGILYTTGDIVFFSDQDDIWLKQKIEVYKHIFEKYEVNVLVSPYIEWHGENRDIPQMKLDYHIVKMHGKFNNYNVTGSGCTLAFRKQYYLEIKKYYVPGWAHDDYFRKLPQLSSGLYVLNSASILRRFHGENESKKKRTYKSTLEELEAGIKSVDMLIQYIHDLNDDVVEKENENFLKRIKRGYISRREYYVNGELHYLLKTVLLNMEQYSRLRQILGDVILVSKEKRIKI